MNKKLIVLAAVCAGFQFGLARTLAHVCAVPAAHDSVAQR
jgi:hypothetical protein